MRVSTCFRPCLFKLLSTSFYIQDLRSLALNLETNAVSVQFLLCGLETSLRHLIVCGNALENGAHTITDCALLNQPFNPNPARVSLTVCTGNTQEICGGPGVISVFTLPGTGLVPLLPFNPSLDNFCAGENCMTET